MKIEIENRTELPEYKVFKVVSDIYESEWRRNSIENEREKKGSFAHFGLRIDDKPLGVFFFPEREITKIVVVSATVKGGVILLDGDDVKGESADEK